MKLKNYKKVLLSVSTILLVSCGDNTIDTKQSRDSTCNTSSQKKTTNKDISTNLTKKEQLGELIFNDTTLSINENMSCASCHAESSAFVDPNPEIPVSRGSFAELFGNRNTPTVTYASFVPAFHYDENKSLYIGGLFLDGNAKGGLVDQAKGPFLNPVEMAMPNGAAVAKKVKHASYASMFKEVYGKDAFDNLDDAYDNIADAIAAFESTEKFHPFNAKYDYFLKGEVELNEQEINGLALFKGKGLCAECHTADVSKDGTHPLFTDFTYDNLGVPANPESPFYGLDEKFNPKGIDFKDKGLGAFLKSEGVDSSVYSTQYGKFRVPTLRNINKTGPYMHNGVFKTLRQVVSFYNNRDVRNWLAPEEDRNVNAAELGNLGLTEAEIDDIVAFLKTLTDNYDIQK